jgi:hypothetical protein
MLAHTFRGSSWRSVLGLESERAVFARYKAIRRTEREYFRGGGDRRFKAPVPLGHLSP